jgi:selenocysteine lyase/cysteine desulfurase
MRSADHGGSRGRGQSPMTPDVFRLRFPALEHTVWLDTPAAGPGAGPVVDAVSEALDAWRSGERHWSSWWEQTRQECRSLIATFLGVPGTSVALVGSVAEAAATVASCLPPGRVVVGAEEYRSNLFPWLALDGRMHQVVCVRSRDGGVRTADLIAAITPGTVLVAVSEVLSCDGVRADLPALRRAADEVAARLFIDATQSQGVLRLDFASLRPDYLAVHGYKWMLCPRGAAWLAVREDRIDQLRPLLPNPQSAADHAWFGGPFRAAPGAARCDTSPAWLSWAGARAALQLILALPPERVERHCLRLAVTFRDGARAAGAVPVGDGTSHIAAARVADSRSLLARLRSSGIRAAALGDRLRVGFHYFNNDSDVEAILSVLRESS